MQTLFPDGGDAAVEPHAPERHASVAEDGTPAVTPAPVVDPKRTDAQTKDRAAGRVSIKGVD